ncbi:short chain dehydrogenase family protein, putative, partial [Ichthyophthirius multifiliis]
VIVFGASRGIGENMAFNLFEKKGYCLCILGKTLHSSQNGSLTDLKEKIIQKGGDCIAIKCDVQDEKQVQNALDTARDYFSKKNVKITCMIYNTGAILHAKVEETNLKKYDLLHKVNARGCYLAIQETLKIFRETPALKCTIIVQSPPIYQRFFRGKTIYAMSKIAMSVLVRGLSFELENSNICIVSIWPATGIESAATEKYDKKLLRKADIMSECVLKILEDENKQKLNGKFIIDEDYLREKGYENFEQFRAQKNFEPPRMMPNTFPDLKVDEEKIEVFNINKQSKL